MSSKQKEPFINYFGFTLLGLVNNFGYWIMLSAAQDIIKENAPSAVVLFCSVFPCLVMALIYPTFQHKVKTYQFVIATTVIACVGFTLAGISKYNYIIGLVGVIITAISQNIGECSMLSYSSLFAPKCVSLWSLGTGMAGIFATFLYMILNSWLQVPHDVIIYTFVVIPLLFGVSYILTKPTHKIQEHFVNLDEDINYTTTQSEFNQTSPDKYIGSLTLWQKLKLMTPFAMLYISLFLVYFSEYIVINGFNAIIEFESHKGKFYTYSMFSTQFGVFLAKLSPMFFILPYKAIPVFTAINLVLVIIFGFEAKFYFIKEFYVIIVFEGLVGFCSGITYASCAYFLKVRARELESKFLLSCVTLFVSTGIIAASICGCIIQDYM